MRVIARSGIAVVLALALFAAGGIGAFRTLRNEEPPAPLPVALGTDLLAPASPGGSLEAAIASLQDRLQLAPTDHEAFASLGLAYVQQARITADPSLYQKAQGALKRSLTLAPKDNEEALVGMAALAAARHDFAAALRWGEWARDVNPYNAAVFGVIGDALVELGRYDEAFDAFQEMVDTEPGLSSYARVSYARELQGEVTGAIVAMREARRLAATPADHAWASYQLGELYFNNARTDRAAAEYRRGLDADPSFVPNLAGLAKVAWARGDLDEAIAGYTEVVQRYPSVEHVAALGDLYTAGGDRELATEQFELVRVEAQLFRANGVNTDLELSLFDADHGHARSALEAARAEWERRPSIHVADALAWALYVNGRYEEAAGYADRALALGTRNALFLYHAGMIELRLGDRDAGRRLLRRALDTNPYFSVQHAPVAERVLARLRGAS